MVRRRIGAGAANLALSDMEAAFTTEPKGH